IIVKLSDSNNVKRFHTHTPTEIIKLAEKAWVKRAKEVNGLTIASAMFIAAKQLKSSDLSLSLQITKETKIMRYYR
ncbi:unnamed protein product, partial [Penicillium salamii]